MVFKLFMVHIMKKQTDTFPLPLSPGLSLLQTRQHNQTDLLLLAAALAQASSTSAAGAANLDGGNHFNAFLVVQALRLHTADLSGLDNLKVARAFNCHQVFALTQKLPADGRPCLVFDLLDTFEDDSIPFNERMRLLGKVVSNLSRLGRSTPVVVSLTPPRQDIEQWNHMAKLVRQAASQTLEEGFMGKTVPTINQIVQEAEIILARFSRVLQPEERQALEELFVSARKHIAAISEANHLIPFEVAQQAMLLEQQKEIIALRAQLTEFKQQLDSRNTKQSGQISSNTYAAYQE